MEAPRLLPEIEPVGDRIFELAPQEILVLCEQISSVTDYGTNQGKLKAVLDELGIPRIYFMKWLECHSRIKKFAEAGCSTWTERGRMPRANSGDSKNVMRELGVKLKKEKKNGNAPENDSNGENQIPQNESHIEKLTRKRVNGNRRFTIRGIHTILEFLNALPEDEISAFYARHHLNNAQISQFRGRLQRALWKNPDVLEQEEENEIFQKPPEMEEDFFLDPEDPKVEAILAIDLFGPILNSSNGRRKNLSFSETAMVLDHIAGLESEDDRDAVIIFCHHYKIDKQQLERWREAFKRRNIPVKNIFEALLIHGDDENFQPQEDDEFKETNAPPGSIDKLNTFADRLKKGLPLWHIDDRQDFGGFTGGITPQHASKADLIK